MKTGRFLMLDRGILDHWLWLKKPFSEGQAWIDLLLLANIEDKKTSYKGEMITCKRGDVNYSIKYLAERWKWSRHKVSDFLNVLEADGMVDTKRTRHRTVISIVNYEVYNVPPKEKGHQKDNKRTSKGQQADINGTQLNNEDNEDNGDKYKAFYPNDEVLDEAFKEYINMRKKIRAPMTDRAITLAMKKLDELSMGDNDKAVKIVNQSVMNSWKGLFPLKDDTPKKKGGSVDWEKEMEEVLKYERSRSTETNPGNNGLIP